MNRCVAGLIAVTVLPTVALGQPFNVRTWYASGQVFVVWQFPAPPAAPTDTVEIYSSPAAQASTMNMTLVGRLFFPEYTGQRLQSLLPAARLALPTPGGGTYILAVDEGVFTFTPHAAGSLFFAVVDSGSTAVAAGNSDVSNFLYDPLLDPVHPLEQFSGFTTGGHPYTAYVIWVDGRADHEDARPDVPVLGSAHKNGVPHVFTITRPLTPPLPGPVPCVFAMHGGGGEYQFFRPGMPQRLNMTLEMLDGIVVTPDDSFYVNVENALERCNTSWFGYATSVDPFDSAPRVSPPLGSLVVNFTQRRMVWILDWLQGSASPYPVDPQRVAMIGHSGGGTGTSHLTRLHPERFCAAVTHNSGFADEPPPGFENFLLGTPDENLPTNLLLDGAPLGVYDILAPTTRIAPTQRDFCLTRAYAGLRDTSSSGGWDSGMRAILDSLNASSMGFMISWDEREHGVDEWDNEENDATDDPAHCDPWPDVGQWIAPVKSERHSAQYLVDSYRADRSYPGFFNVDEDPVTPGRQPDPGPGDPCSATPFDVWGTWGGYCDWDANTIVDQSDLWECTVFLRGLSPISIDNALVASLTADVSLRKTQQFNPLEGTTLNWRLEDEDTQALLQSGTAVAAAESLVIIPGLNIRRDPDRSRLIVSTQPGPAIPTVSQWGIVVMALLMLTAGTVVMRHRAPRRIPCCAGFIA